MKAIRLISISTIQGELLLNPKDVVGFTSEPGQSHCKVKLERPVQISGDGEPDQFLLVQESHDQVRETLIRAYPEMFV